MTAKEYLRQIYKIDEYIKSKEAQKRKTRERLEHSSNRLSKEPKATMQGDKLSDGVSTMLDIQAEIDRSIGKSLLLQKKISKEIDMMEDNVHKAILVRRYLNCETWSEIARELCYDVKYIHSVHSEALKNFKTSD